MYIRRGQQGDVIGRINPVLDMSEELPNQSQGISPSIPKDNSRDPENSDLLGIFCREGIYHESISTDIRDEECETEGSIQEEEIEHPYETPIGSDMDGLVGTEEANNMSDFNDQGDISRSGAGNRPLPDRPMNSPQ